MHTVDGVEYDTFRDACHARSLLDDDNDLKTMLDEGRYLRMGHSLRSMFLSIIRECYPSQLLQLWHLYKAMICDDLMRTLTRLNFVNPSPELAQDYGLYLLQKELSIDSNKTLSHFGLIDCQNDWDRLLGNDFFRQHASYDPETEREQLQTCLPLLNNEQRFAFDSIMNVIRNKTARIFFVEGAAGAGKTFLYNALGHAVRSQEMIVLCVASSGIAALLLPGGRTAHSCFKIPIDIHDHSVCSLTRQSAFAAFIDAVSLLIWDKASMQHR